MAVDDYTAPTTRAANYVVTAANWNEEVVNNFTAFLSAVQGDAQATGEIILSHKTGTLANRPAAGNAGRLYTATDLGATFYDDGAVWHVSSHIHAICDRLFEDFHLSHNDSIAATGYMGGWRVVIGGAGGAASSPDNTSHSYIEIKGTTAAGGFCNLTPKGSAVQYITPGGDNYPLIFESAVRINGGNNSDYHFGIMDGPSQARPAAPNSSIMFRVADAGNIFTVTQDNGGGETTNDMGATPTGSGIDLFRIEVFSPNSAVFTFWKGGLGGTKYTETHAAAIPSVEALLPAYSVRTNAAADRVMRIDSCDLLYKRDY